MFRSIRAHACPPKIFESLDFWYPPRKSLLYILLCLSAKIKHCETPHKKNAFTEFQRVKFIFWLSKMGYLRLLEEGEEDKEEVKGVDVSSFKYY